MLRLKDWETVCVTAVSETILHHQHWTEKYVQVQTNTEQSCYVTNTPLSVLRLQLQYGNPNHIKSTNQKSHPLLPTACFS